MSSEQHSPRSKAAERAGRWSREESRLFQQLIQDYGKDWKKIHSFMPRRSLAQIRSHGQKFFAKIGNNKMKELERKAKLLAAMEILKADNMEEQFERLRRQLPQNTPPASHATPQNSPEVKSEDIFEEQPQVKKEGRAQGELRENQSIEPASKTESMLYPFYQSSPEMLAKLQYPVPEDLLDPKHSFNQGGHHDCLPPQ